jgi:hypothetical protein
MTDTGVGPGEVHWYTVEFMNGVGQISLPSDPLIVQVPECPDGY